jgi:hypothetical protein
MFAMYLLHIKFHMTSPLWFIIKARAKTFFLRPPYSDRFYNTCTHLRLFVKNHKIQNHLRSSYNSYVGSPLFVRGELAFGVMKFISSCMKIRPFFKIY